MKKILLLLIPAIAFMGCVDDYEDANPPRKLDGPEPFTYEVGDEIVATNTDDDTYTWVPNGGTARMEIYISDAPGLINEVTVGLSNSQLPEDWGTVAIEGFDAVKGKEKGTFTVVYTAPTLDDNSEFSVALENLTITVSDAQSPAKSVDIELPTMRTQFSQGSDCFSNINLVGFYSTVTSGFDAENGEDYVDLTDTVEVSINEGVESPGFYRLSDGSFGLYPYQGYDPALTRFEVCNTNILNSIGDFEDSFAGTINEDGSISITWSNPYGDTGTTTMTPIAAPEE